MKFATISTMLMSVATHAVFCSSLLADGRGHGSMGMAHGGGSGGGSVRMQAPQMMNGGGGGGMKLPGVMVAPRSQTLSSGGFTTIPMQGNGMIQSKGSMLPARGPLTPGYGQTPMIQKHIGLGIGNGKPPVVIKPLKPIDLGMGKGTRVIDPGFGNGKGRNPIKLDPKMVDVLKPVIRLKERETLGGNIKVTPELAGKLKGAVTRENVTLNPSLVDKLKGAIKGPRIELNPELVDKLKGAINDDKMQLDPELADKLKGAIKGEKIALNPELAGKLKGAINGNKIKLTPELVDKINGAILKPKIPICPPYPYPHKPHWCPPCPPIFHGWCWYPGFNQCYGYVGGLALPPMIAGPTYVDLPPVEVLPSGGLPQIVPGTVVVATVMGAGDTMGQVMMQYNSVAMPAEVQKWEGDKVTFVVPAVALQQPVEVKLVFLRSTGEMAHEVNAELVAATVEQQD